MASPLQTGSFLMHYMAVGHSLLYYGLLLVLNAYVTLLCPCMHRIYFTASFFYFYLANCVTISIIHTAAQL